MPYCVVLVVFPKSMTVKNVWQKVYVMLIEKAIAGTVSVNGYNRKARGRMKPILNVNFNMNIATLVFSDGYSVVLTYNELQEVYKLLKDTFEDIKEQTNE